MGIGPVPGLSAGFLQIGVSAFTMHDQAVPPVPPAPTPLPNVPGLIEGPAFMGNPLGKLTHKVATKTMFDGNVAVQYGHDIGFVIPHFAIPMNALCAANTAFSKHKVAFPVSSVQIEGKPFGTYLFFLGGIICANPVSLPTGVVMLLKCTVWSAMSIADLLIGALTMAIDALFDWIWNKTFKRLFPKFGSGLPIQVLGGLTLREMVTWGGAGLVGRYVSAKVVEKGFQWIIKNLVVGPLVKPLPLLGSGQIPGAPPWLGDQRPGLGSGNWGPKFFKPENAGAAHGATGAT